MAARLGYWDRRFAANGMGLSLEERIERDEATAREAEEAVLRRSRGYDDRPCPGCGEDRPAGVTYCLACHFAKVEDLGDAKREQKLVDERAGVRP